MTEEFRSLSIDRIEHRSDGTPLAILSDDDDRIYTVEATKLAPSPEEAQLFRVRFAGGNPDWSSAERDVQEEQRCRAALAAQRARLVRGDPGGDISL